MCKFSSSVGTDFACYQRAVSSELYLGCIFNYFLLISLRSRLNLAVC